MKLACAVATALLLAWALQAEAETTDTITKIEVEQDDTSEVASQTKSKEDSEEEVVTEDWETIIEHLREITALQDTIRSLLPPADTYIAGKTTKQQIGKNDDDDDGISKETLTSWAKTMDLQSKGGDSLHSSIEQGLSEEEEELENWSEEKPIESQPEKDPEPLTPQEQEGNIFMQLHKHDRHIFSQMYKINHPFVL